jgi:hypothetical protein
MGFLLESPVQLADSQVPYLSTPRGALHLEYNNDVVEKADQLTRRASNYIMRHDLISSNVADGSIGEDADRLRAVQEAFAGFCVAVEHSKPNSRVRTLGLA